ncbi:MAG: Xaa-Pro peptidase family protein [Syntrophobacteraceae bacterium]|nr:Xaa-Pro peptidase family protein [Syntrophobacteraceae bacterium]
MRDVHSKRLERFRKLMEAQELDAFLVSVPENRCYLSGFEAEDLLLTESSGRLLITPTEQYLLTDPRYAQEATKEASGFKVEIYSMGLKQLLPDLFSRLTIKRLGVEEHFLTLSGFREVQEALAGARPSAEVIALEDMVEGLRMVKDEEEIEKIRKSIRLTESALHTVWNALAIGRTEIEMAWLIEKTIRESGGQAVSFPPIVAAGPNGALPHAVPTSRKIAAGDTVILDLGSKLDGYCSDMTRTWIAGVPDAKMKEIYKTVREAQLAAQDKICAGIDSVAVDSAARDLITQAGYGDFFGHGLGHGVGLAVHEKPGLRKANPTLLEENMIVTVEPGIYLPGIGGVRLENMVRVTKAGCELLTREELFYDFQP